METIAIQKSKLPEGWEVKRLGEITEIIMGQSPPSKTYNIKKIGLPFFQGKAEFGEIHPVPRKWCSEPNKIAKKNDVLISVRAPVGPVNLADSECCIGRGLCAIRANSERLNFKYIYNFLKLQEEVLAQKGQGSTFSAISRRDVQEILVPLPPLPIQHQIVSKLDAFFESYNKLKQEKQKAKEKYGQILQSAIASLIPQKELPEGWKKDKLANLCSQKPQYGYTATSSKEKVGPIYLRITDIDFKGKIEWDNVKYVDIPKEEHRKFKLEQGDIIIARTGATVGKSYLYTNDKDMVFASYLIRFRSNPEVLLPKYLIIYLQSSLYWSYISKEQSGTGQPNVNAKKLGDLEIIYPKKIRDQEYIVKKIKGFNDNIKIFSEEQQNIDFQLEKLPKSVLSKAFKGELL